MYKILFISSRKRAGALATPKGMTVHVNTLPLGVIKASCGGYIYLTETTGFVHFGLVPAFGNTLQGIFHVGNTSWVVLGFLVDLTIVKNQS